MLSDRTFQELVEKYYSSREEEYISPDRIELKRIDESKGNYHNEIIIHPKKESSLESKSKK